MKVQTGIQAFGYEIPEETNLGLPTILDTDEVVASLADTQIAPTNGVNVYQDLSTLEYEIHNFVNRGNLNPISRHSKFAIKSLENLITALETITHLNDGDVSTQSEIVNKQRLISLMYSYSELLAVLFSGISKLDPDDVRLALKEFQKTSLDSDLSFDNKKLKSYIQYIKDLMKVVLERLESLERGEITQYKPIALESMMESLNKYYNGIEA